MPLLFVNRQVYLELLQVLYSQLSVNIPGYYLKHLKGVPDEFRQMKRAAKWPRKGRSEGMTNHVKKLNIALTYGRRLHRLWQFDCAWYHLTLNCSEHIAVYDPNWTIMPNLVKYLDNLNGLKALRITVEIYEKFYGHITNLEEGDLDRLLPFDEIANRGISVAVNAIFKSVADRSDEDKWRMGRHSVKVWKEQVGQWIIKSGLNDWRMVE